MRASNSRILTTRGSGNSHRTNALNLSPINHQVPTWTDGKHAIAHNKVMIIDGETIITGSFNFSRQAESSNAENMLIITGKPKLVVAYERNFEEHLGHSEPYEGVKEKTN
jgi:phosphatidylserine/phosphatidylglycerophosphate/cardiolipin synthase-like enzyme